MEIKISINHYTGMKCELPVEAIIETTIVNKLSPEVPNYTSINEFFENYEQSKDWIRKGLNEILNKL